MADPTQPETVFPKCGHPRTPENTHTVRGKYFYCRECNLASATRCRREGRQNEDEKFFNPSTIIGRVRTEVLNLHQKHQAQGLLPTNGRFMFYELVAAGVIDKKQYNDLIDALTDLRKSKRIPWSDIRDESRDITRNYHFPTLREDVEVSIEHSRTSLWHPAPPPLVLCESRSIRSAIDPLCSEYQVPVASVNGQCAGFLYTDVADILTPGQTVLYLGDLDLSGGKIENNVRACLEEVSGSQLDWSRVAITPKQVKRYGLIPIPRTDQRNGKNHDAVECEALGQERLVALFHNSLRRLMPDTRRNKVLATEKRERRSLMRQFSGLKGKH